MIKTREQRSYLRRQQQAIRTPYYYCCQLRRTTDSRSAVPKIQSACSTKSENPYVMLIIIVFPKVPPIRFQNKHAIKFSCWTWHWMFPSPELSTLHGGFVIIVAQYSRAGFVLQSFAARSSIDHRRKRSVFILTEVGPRDTPQRARGRDRRRVNPIRALQSRNKLSDSKSASNVDQTSSLSCIRSYVSSLLLKTEQS